MYLIRLAEKCHVDLPQAAMEKIGLNAKKYPAHKVHGSSKKYTEYEWVSFYILLDDDQMVGLKGDIVLFWSLIMEFPSSPWSETPWETLGKEQVRVYTMIN